MTANLFTYWHGFQTDMNNFPGALTLLTLQLRSVGMIGILAIAVVGFLSPKVNGQQADSLSPEMWGIKNLTEYLNLRSEDITYRSDYTEPDSFRLKIVADLMKNPIGMEEYAGRLRKSYVRRQPEVLAASLFGELRSEYQIRRSSPYQASADELQKKYDLFYSHLRINEILTRAAAYINVIIPRSTDKAMAFLTPKQQRFLRNEFKEFLEVDSLEETRTVEELDSSERRQEQLSDSFVTFGYKFDKDPIMAASVDCLRELMPEIQHIRRYLDSTGGNADKLLGTAAYVPPNVSMESYLGRQKGWKVGGTGNDTYTGDYSFILDLGGDDTYDLTYDPAHPHPVIIIDLSGDDHYTGQTDFTLGSGCFSGGMLLDFGGNDRYDAKSFGLGSAYFGFGLLYDAGGDDRYNGDTHVEGAGTFGMGLLIDESGRDIYHAAVYSQGFGFIQGLGAIYEADGSDVYYAGGKYKDILRYEDHYLSLSQGFGYGLRPWCSGGIGTIIDLKGFDTYYTDIFGQGTSYWWSLGILYDSSGSDNYQSYQYAQGTATHMSLGYLEDDYGNDVYFGKGLMQGVGHDYSCGWILDKHGNDTYTAYDLSQGAGSANGAGIQIDCEGDDRYLIKNPKNTQGFGDTRRDFGSIGLFIDLNGDDQYNGNGRNNGYWRTDSRWGGGMDIQRIAKDTTKGSK
jgi:hypothetical protein